jgi:hypothetical protein
MRIITYTLDGVAGPAAELRRDAQAQLWLDGTLVLAESVWGSRVGLTLTDRIVLIDSADYWALRSDAPEAAADLAL